jgi:hypothetical protein
MHRKPTYEEVIRDTITHPTDKIELPDRVATQIRNLPKLIRFDDDNSLNLSEDQEKIAKERVREIAVRNITSEHHTHTHTVYQAAQPPSTELPFEPPPQPPPPAAKAHSMGTATQTDYRNPAQARSTSTTGLSAAPLFAGGGAPPAAPPPAPTIRVDNPFQPNLQASIQAQHELNRQQLIEDERVRQARRDEFERKFFTAPLGPDASTANQHNIFLGWRTWQQAAAEEEHHHHHQRQQQFKRANP